MGSMEGHQAAKDPAAQFFGILLALIGSAVCVFIVALAVLKLLTAKALRERRSRTLCLITAGISCLAIPYGTALGVATFLVLSRPSVQQQFT